jgi:hypothetical protein
LFGGNNSPPSDLKLLMHLHIYYYRKEMLNSI